MRPHFSNTASSARAQSASDVTFSTCRVASMPLAASASTAGFSLSSRMSNRAMRAPRPPRCLSGRVGSQAGKRGGGGCAGVSARRGAQRRAHSLSDPKADALRATGDDHLRGREGGARSRLASEHCRPLRPCTIWAGGGHPCDRDATGNLKAGRVRRARPRGCENSQLVPRTAFRPSPPLRPLLRPRLRRWWWPCLLNRARKLRTSVRRRAWRAAPPTPPPVSQRGQQVVVQVDDFRVGGIRSSGGRGRGRGCRGRRL
jgi:hypothetical protein